MPAPAPAKVPAEEALDHIPKDDGIGEGKEKKEKYRGPPLWVQLFREHPELL